MKTFICFALVNFKLTLAGVEDCIAMPVLVSHTRLKMFTCIVLASETIQLAFLDTLIFSCCIYTGYICNVLEHYTRSVNNLCDLLWWDPWQRLNSAGTGYTQADLAVFSLATFYVNCFPRMTLLLRYPATQLSITPSRKLSVVFLDSTC